MDIVDQSPQRKKSKPKKSRRDFDDDASNELVIVEDISNSSNSKSKMTTPLAKQITSTTPSNNKKRKKRDSGSSDEERWLTAIESGKLEDVDDELKKIKPKDPALMTARQRAMYDRGGDGSPSSSAPTLMSLPTGYKEKVMTAEAIQKAAIKSQKRKQLADEKREKDKKKTMERLLKKQESKLLKAVKSKTPKNTEPVIIYKQNVDRTELILPENIDYEIKAKKIMYPPPAVLCSMGCGRTKKYRCSQTGVDLCSLECYKKNIASRIL